MKCVIVEPRIREYVDAQCRLLVHGVVVKEWVQKNAAGFLNEHHYPNWMPLTMHIVIEKQLERHYKVFPSQLYHFFHGLLCGYGIKKILSFIGATTPNV